MSSGWRHVDVARATALLHVRVVSTVSLGLHSENQYGVPDASGRARRVKDDLVVLPEPFEKAQRPALAATVLPHSLQNLG